MDLEGVSAVVSSILHIFPFATGWVSYTINGYIYIF